MTKKLQIATLRDKYEHVIQVDRTFGSDEIILLIIKSDIEDDSNLKQKINDNIQKIRDYSELVKSNLRMIEEIDLKNMKTVYEVISKCVDIILKHSVYNDKVVVTLTEGSFTLNGALHYAATIVKGFYDIDITINITEEIGGESISHIQEKLITSSIWNLISTKDKPLILDCIAVGMNVEEMALVLDVSPGTISNWMHLLEENDILEISKRERKLTNLGKLVAKVTERERVKVFANKYRPIISKQLAEGKTYKQLAKIYDIPEGMLKQWLDSFPDESVYASIQETLSYDEMKKKIKMLLEMKKNNE